ncbi:MAG: hypothetical protein AAF206_04450 [Bacteroidota bacterium]
MDFAFILDILMIIIGLGALGVLAWKIWPMVNQPAEVAPPVEKPVRQKIDTKVKPPKTTLPSSHPKAVDKKTDKPVSRPQTQPSVKSKSIIEQVKAEKDKTQKPPSRLDKLSNKPVNGKPLTEAANSKAPFLKPDRLILVAPNVLSLTLTNKGGDLVFEKIKPGPNNELQITFEPLNGRSDGKSIMSPGSNLNISIKGEQVIYKTYQFVIEYRDLKGQMYRQQIAGMGKEYPIVDEAVKV